MTPEQVIAQLTGVGQQSLEAAQRGALIVGERIVADAKEKAPGSLSETINVSQTENETIIIAGAEIAAYVEFGTGTDNVEANFAVFGNDPGMIAEAGKFVVNRLGKGKAQPFFFPAIFNHQEELIPEIENELQKLAN